MTIDEIMALPAVTDFLETWAAHCGAPRAVFTGHVRSMLKKIRAEAARESERLIEEVDKIIANRVADTGACTEGNCDCSYCCAVRLRGLLT